MKTKYVDVLVVGSGVAGLYCALNLRQDLDVMVVSKDKLDCTNTYLAQGGISVARDINDVPLFAEDTLKAGKYENDLQAVKVLTRESIENVDSLVALGLDVDKDEDGKWDYTKEGAHCVNRIIHTQDNTGENVAKTLIKNALCRDNIQISEDTFLVDIIVKNNKCIGGILFKDNKQINIFAKSIVLACGGIGGLYKNSTSQRILNGDGLAIAIRHDVELKDINYIQIHPTAFYDEFDEGRRFLISESVRGEGGKLYNVNGESFIDELLPRDVVSQAIFKEMEKTNSPYVLLDVSFLDEDYLKNRFSTIYNKCLEKGTDITKEPIKVSPAQHYFMGGIKVDLDAKTSMENLYALGETACTGIHGANRLASNSLLEGLVFSKRASSKINNKIDSFNLTKIDVDKIYASQEEVENDNRKIVVKAIRDKGGVIDD
ncbi:MAG: L-aspartate oxidase [Terrisporobacter sp.]|uniref:L-aspartate oxidase n=1 Tax=Terrisporobacter sp. TaxID=1965305 RepID=UPI002FC9E4B7